MNSSNGARVTTADAYLPAAAGTRPNLTVRAGAHVAGVVFDGDRAAGVRLLDGSVVEAGWVVVSAGTYGSPPILMRSGIGPADHLRSMAVAVRADLPGVGANLADHPAVDVACGPSGPGRGAPALHVIATFHSADRADGEAPDMLLWVPDPSVSAGEPDPFEIGVVLMKPRSRGAVRLRSPDPAAAPRIELPALSDPSDVERLAEGFRRGREVAADPAIRRVCAEPLQDAPAGDESLRDMIRAEAYSIPHVVGTCAMGPRPDDGAVVDPSGRVHGTEGLSVVDASIIPDAPSGFPHIVAIMMAERLSEEIASRI
jgi:choline dehydrogenase